MPVFSKQMIGIYRSERIFYPKCFISKNFEIHPSKINFQSIEIRFHVKSVSRRNPYPGEISFQVKAVSRWNPFPDEICMQVKSVCRWNPYPGEIRIQMKSVSRWNTKLLRFFQAHIRKWSFGFLQFSSTLCVYISYVEIIHTSYGMSHHFRRTWLSVLTCSFIGMLVLYIIHPKASLCAYISSWFHIISALAIFNSSSVHFFKQQ